MTQQLIGIFGGTFDPVHLGHVKFAQDMQQQLPLREICFVPCKQQVFKTAAKANTEQRVAMLQLALEKNPTFIIDQRELTRDTPSYMLETLISFHQDYPNTPLALLLGMDVFYELPKWHCWQELLDYAHIIIGNRPGTKMPEEKSPISDYLKQHSTSQISAITARMAGLIYIQQVDTLPIASSNIRKQLYAGQSGTDYLPENVYHYIRQHKLYGTK